MPAKKRPSEYLEQARSFVRDYTAGLNVKEVKRLFDEEAPQAYKVLARDQKAIESKDEVTRFFAMSKVVFLGISARLTPTRRALFLISILTLLWGLLTAAGLRVTVFFPLSPLFNASTLWLLFSAAGLLFLLTMELVDRVRVRDELEVARELQRDLMPYAAPSLDGYRFAHSYRTANEVGGDYYDFLVLPDGRLGLLIGDASGHGIAAGLLMAIANATLKTAIEIDPAPLEVARLLNTTLCRTGDRRAFMTLFYAVLEPDSGRLDYVCAGHPFPLLRRTSGRVEELGEGSLPLGMRDEPTLPQGHLVLEPGDLLVLFTDGLAEATAGAKQRAFGFDRLHNLTAAGGAPVDVHKRIMGAFGGHVGDGPLTDDITLVVIGRDSASATGPPPAPPA